MSRFTLHLVWFRLNILENKDINIPGNEMLNMNLTIGSSNVQIIFESWPVTTESQRRKSDSLQLLVLLAPLQSICLVLLRLEIMVSPVQYHQSPLTRSGQHNDKDPTCVSSEIHKKQKSCVGGNEWSDHLTLTFCLCSTLSRSAG